MQEVYATYLEVGIGYISKSCRKKQRIHWNKDVLPKSRLSLTCKALRNDHHQQPIKVGGKRSVFIMYETQSKENHLA